jgi:ATP-dependent phosphoenolpyruvate carboxykinase
MQALTCPKYTSSATPRSPSSTRMPSDTRVGPPHFDPHCRFGTNDVPSGAIISSSGALINFSGKKTGRSPKDKRIVYEETSKDDIWWGPVNIKMDEHTFEINRERAIDYLNTRDLVYVFDGYAGWDPRYRIKVRVVCARAYHALFMVCP